MRDAMMPMCAELKMRAPLFSLLMKSFKPYKPRDKKVNRNYIMAAEKGGKANKKTWLIKDEKKAYHYYLAGIEASFRTMYYYNYYNLANYYIEGRLDLGIEKDVNKALEYYKIASDNSINPTLLAELNGINVDDYIYPNQILLVSKAGIILCITQLIIWLYVIWN